MTAPRGAQVAKHLFEQAKPRLARVAGRFVDDAPAVVEAAEAHFDGMIPDMAYVDKPFHPLASALFVCSINLAIYLALKQRGVDVHAFGRALLTGLARAPVPSPGPPESEQELLARLAEFVSAAETSQKNPQRGEDVFEVRVGDGTDFEFGYNVTSCAVCFQFAKYDAMDLVPYMCAADDVMSDKEDRGLRRTGSIALGAHQCDFRYKHGGEPRRLAEQYPDRIRIATSV